MILLFALDVALGSASLSAVELVQALDPRQPADATSTRIVREFRLPKAATAALAGAALAAAGLAMQALFRNPLAGPFVLGISSGASLGVALVLLSAGVGAERLLASVGLGGSVAVATAASLGAAAALGLVLAVAQRVSVVTLLVLGMLFGHAASALVSILLHFSLAERVQAYVVWTFGSFAGTTRGELAVLAGATTLGFVLLALAVKPLDALLLGEAHARSLGVSIGAARLTLIGATALLAGSVTAFCGPIGFVGVAVPHLARGLLRRATHGALLPACALLGAAVALAADLLAQLPGVEAVLPLNAVTALLGAPVVAAIVLRRRIDGAFA
ncbi:MAG: iron chelate uptake ABC transporter family permease subunit [Acidobacteriota bacterium]